MPSPVTPNDLKELLNDTGAPFCEKFFNLLKRFPERVYEILFYERNEDGTISDAMKDDICALECAGGSGGGGGGSLAAPTGVSATDGTLGDRVRVTWNAVAAATSYEIYRRDIATVEGSTQIGTSTLAEFDDTTAVDDVVYYYWVKSVNATQTSAYSSPDSGYISTALGAVSNLDASQGFYDDSTGFINLVWTPVTGATAYDIYRSTTNTFSTATLIDSDRTPFNNAASLSTGPTPTFVDNGGELIYYHQPPSAFTAYYFWVKAKRTTPTPATSAESNSAQGWVIGWGDGLAILSSASLSANNQTTTVPMGVTKAWLVLFGNGGGGAGGSGAFGGGAGGGGAIAWGELAVAGGGVLKLVLSAGPTGNAPTATNGGAGAVTEVQYQPPAGVFGMVMQSSSAGGGIFSATGGGAGGAGSTGSTAGITNPQTRPGRAGGAASGNQGGRGGYRFGAWRFPGAHFSGFAGGGWSGDNSQGGSGSYASPSAPALATGGDNSSNGLQAIVRIIYRV